MNGRPLMIGFLGLAVVFGGALFYTQNYAFYDRADGRASIDVQGRVVPVTGYLGIDAASSGLKRRGCFQVDPADFAALEPATAPEPLTAPYWFDCFDAETIARDLGAGRATAYLAAVEEQDGIDRLVAVYPDGRAYEWRQLNEKFAK